MGGGGRRPHFVFTSPVHLEFDEQGCWTVVLTAEIEAEIEAENARRIS